MAIPSASDITRLSTSTSAFAAGGAGLAWSAVSANTTMVAGNGYTATGALDMTLPATVAAGDEFIVHSQDSTVRVVSNGNVIADVGSGNNLTIENGESVHLVANAAGALEVV